MRRLRTTTTRSIRLRRRFRQVRLYTPTSKVSRARRVTQCCTSRHRRLLHLLRRTRRNGSGTSHTNCNEGVRQASKEVLQGTKAADHALFHRFETQRKSLSNSSTSLFPNERSSSSANGDLRQFLRRRNLRELYM